MIPALPELQSFNSSIKGEIDRGQSGHSETESPDAGASVVGDMPGFDDLVAAALQPSALAKPAETQGRVYGQDQIAKLQSYHTPGEEPGSRLDVPVKPGISLPTSGNQMPELPDEKNLLTVFESAQTRLDSVRSLAPRDTAAVAIQSAVEPGEITPPLDAPDHAPPPRIDGPVIEGFQTADLPEQPIKPDALIQTAPQQTDAETTSVEDDLWMPRGGSAAQAPIKDAGAKATRPADAEPVLVAIPSGLKNMRADQPITDQARPKLVGASPKTVVAPAVRAIGPVESDAALDPEPSALRKVEQAAPVQQPALASQPALGTQPASDLGQSTQSQQAPPLTAPVIQTTAAPAPSATEVRTETRIAPQIEQAIDALADAREAGRASRPEVLMRHSEFGLVSMRLEALSGDLRATLASRDPGFVPAIQAALSERSVAASSETATSQNNQRSPDQGQSNQNSSSFSGSNSGFAQNYGSSPGSSQGSPQPRMAQQETTPHGTDERNRSGAAETPSPISGGGGVFA